MDSKQRTIALMPLFLAIAVGVGFLLGHYFNKTTVPKEEKQQMLKVNTILNYVEENYVDDVSRDKLVEESISAMLSELDPHSAYIPARFTQQHNEQLKGHFGGVGIKFRIYGDSLMVVNVIKGGPSERAGIKAGDRIVSVDEEEVADDGLSNQEVMDKLKGAPGTKVELGIFRKGDRIDRTVIRGSIPLPSIESYFMLNDAVGYVHLSSFSETTMQEFVPIVNRLKLSGMKDLVLDLRGNRGGYLKQAVGMADQMLKAGELIVYTYGKNSPREEYRATAQGNLESNGIYILIDEGSASASEILAGAIQDNDRGRILGRRSFGKGLVQKPHEFEDGSELRLTIARYYTPAGRSIQKPYGKEIDYEEDYEKRLKNGELYAPDSSLFVDSLKFETVHEKRPVYGGGGIMPDIFVPFDTSEMTPSYNVVRYHMEEFVFYFLDRKRDELKANYKDFLDFGNNFEADTADVNQLIEFARSKHGAFLRDDELELSYSLIADQFKRSIASHLYGTIGRVYVMSQSDGEIKRALKFIREKK